jgi:hypothetical protein
MHPVSENLDFEITLSGTYWGNRYPEYEISISDTIITSDRITAYPSKKGLLHDEFMSPGREESTYQTVKFTHALAPGEHLLNIRFKNKQPGDTCEFVDGQWQKDVLLNIEKIVVDGVDFSHLLFSESTYTFDSPQEINNQLVSSTTACVNLGFNGVYSIKFSSPFYIWLLERL